MSEQKKELWRELCAQAAVEQDPQKLHELVREIIRLLEPKEQRSQQPSSSTDSKTQPAGQFESTMTETEESCPYCVVDGKFRPMTVRSNGSICENCGHTVFPNDPVFTCPCPGCLKLSSWDHPRVRRQPQR
jgi:hypothetical protein